MTREDYKQRLETLWQGSKAKQADTAQDDSSTSNDPTKYWEPRFARLNTMAAPASANPREDFKARLSTLWRQKPNASDKTVGDARSMNDDPILAPIRFTDHAASDGLPTVGAALRLAREQRRISGGAA